MKELIIAIAFVVAIFAGITAIAMAMVSYDCGVYSEVTGRQAISRFGTCYVKTERGFIPMDELQYRATTNEDVK